MRVQHASGLFGSRFTWFAAALIGAFAADPAGAEPRIDGLVQNLPEPARKALDRIPDQDRKLLAMRSYLRSARSIESRWSWTAAEIEAYRKSDQYVTAMAAVAAVSKAFELKNPGYTLHINTEVRSLDEQIEKWNANGSVKAAAGEIGATTTKWLADNPKAGPGDLRNFLSDWNPASTASLAAPGLTAHGRGAAFDFQVAKGGAVIAGADTGSVSGRWEGDGWSEKLKEAVLLSTLPFEGPLTDPNEPWHYDYKPLETFRPDPSAIAAASPPPEVDKPADPQPAGTAASALPADAASTSEQAIPEVPIAGPVPVPAPRAQQQAQAGQATTEPAKQTTRKAERTTPRKSVKKQSTRKKARSKTRRTTKKRWPLPF